MSETTTAQIVGRSDYGMGVEMTKVVIGDEEFLTRNGRFYRACHKCLNASGTITAYMGIDAGVCYGCTGRGVAAKSYDSVEQIEKAQQARARREARAVAKMEAEAAEARAARDTWVAANPVAAERLAAVYAEVYGNVEQYSDAAYEASRKGEEKYGEFVLLMANYASYKALTEAQTASAIEALDEAEARAAAAAAKAAAARHLDAAVGAKVEVTGRVAVAMNVDGYAYGSTDRMLVIEGDGEFEGITFKITGSGKTLWDTARGDVVKVAATVKRFAEYNGTPQTVLTRAKVSVTTPAA